MENTLEQLYALRAQMSAADLPLDAINEKIRIEEEKASSLKKDLEEITSSFQTFIQPVIKKWGVKCAELQALYKEAELSSLIMNLDGKDVFLFQDPADEFLPAPHTKRMKEALKVLFPDGTEIFEPQASVTLGNAIERIGPEKVYPLNIQGLMSRDPDEFKASQTVGDRYYVNTHSNTDAKRRQLEEISRKLGLNLVVNVVPGVYKSRSSRRLLNRTGKTRVDVDQLLKELETGILAISPDISVDKSLKSYLQFTLNSSYVANVIPRKKRIQVMLNDEYSRIKGLEGVIEAPDAHYGHMNCYYDVSNHEGVTTVLSYISKMIRLPEESDAPTKIRIRLDKTAAD